MVRRSIEAVLQPVETSLVGNLVNIIQECQDTLFRTYLKNSDETVQTRSVLPNGISYDPIPETFLNHGTQMPPPDHHLTSLLESAYRQPPPLLNMDGENDLYSLSRFSNSALHNTIPTDSAYGTEKLYNHGPAEGICPETTSNNGTQETMDTFPNLNEISNTIPCTIDSGPQGTTDTFLSPNQMSNTIPSTIHSGTQATTDTFPILSQISATNPRTVKFTDSSYGTEELCNCPGECSCTVAFMDKRDSWPVLSDRKASNNSKNRETADDVRPGGELPVHDEAFGLLDWSSHDSLGWDIDGSPYMSTARF
jgi:hypothetical protein